MSEIIRNQNGIPFDIDNLINDVNDKADRDGTNMIDQLSPAAQVYFANLGSGGGIALRSIGEIVVSTVPVVDASLHLLDGSILQYGSYSAFVDYIAGLTTDYPNLFTTENAWQTAVNTYGVCGKFVYNSTSKTVRLPRYSNKIYTGGGEAPVKGNGMTLGLTDGTHNGGLFGQGNQILVVNNESYGKDIGYGTNTNIFNYDKSLGLVTDSSKSGVIADLANITTSLDGYYYIVIATTTKTAIQVDIDQIATDLNGKADVDLGNVDATVFKNNIMNWVAPDWAHKKSITKATTYTADSNGYVLVESIERGGSGAIRLQIYINSTLMLQYDGSPGAGGYWMDGLWLPVAKGDTYKVDDSSNSSVSWAYFIPVKGV